MTLKKKIKEALFCYYDRKCFKTDDAQMEAIWGFISNLLSKQKQELKEKIEKMKKKEKKYDFRKSWVFKATKEELDNCICCDYDGKGVSCCGFPCPVHGKKTKPKKKIKEEFDDKNKKM